MSAPEMSDYARALAASANAYLAWEGESARAYPKLPRVTRLDRNHELIEELDGWGRPVRYTRTIED